MPLFGPSIPDFDRHSWPHWKDLDGDGQNAREEVLERDSLVPVKKDANGKITAGLWSCLYTGRVHDTPKKIDIDHIISLGEGHRMGGHAWDTEKKKQFANDPDNLLAVWNSSNRSKSDRDSFEGMPPNLSNWGIYMELRGRVVEKYGLERTAAELRAIKFYKNRWRKHRLWVKMGAVRTFLPKWVPGTF